jgi:hypothetical protein
MNPFSQWQNFTMKVPKKMLQFPPFIDSSNSENAITICHVKKIDFKIHYVGHDK